MKEHLEMCRRALDTNTNRPWCLVVSNIHVMYDGTLAAYSLAKFKQSVDSAGRFHGIKLFIPIINTYRVGLANYNYLQHILSKWNVSKELIICIEEIKLPMFDAYILISTGLNNRYFGLDLDESRIKMIFCHNDVEPEFEIGADCERVFKSAACVSTVVADYIMDHDSDSDTFKIPLLVLLHRAIMYCTKNLKTSQKMDRDLVEAFERGKQNYRLYATTVSVAMVITLLFALFY